MKRTVLIAFASFMFMTGCKQSGNKLGIVVKGCIVDSVTNNPLPNSKVTILCWYHKAWDKEDFVSIDTVTNSNGCFSGSFKEGYKVTIASIASNHLPALQEYKDLNIAINATLKLKEGISLTVNPDKPNLTDLIIRNTNN